jgi:hypothetical protein
VLLEAHFPLSSRDEFRRRSRSPRGGPRREDREDHDPRKEEYRRRDEKEPRDYERRY